MDFTQIERERIWEWFFGKKYSLKKIGREYGVDGQHIARLIDAESERRWRKDHKSEANRIKLIH